MLNFTNKAFDQMPFTIKMAVVFSRFSSAIMTFRNDNFSTRSSDSLDKRLGIVTFIGNQTFKSNICD